MFLAIALSSTLISSDSLVTPLETGGLSYERMYTTWEEVVVHRKKANLAGFGSVATFKNDGGFTLEFRIYGDSSAQHSQWMRLEKLLNESLEWIDRTASSHLDTMTGTSDEVFQLAAMDTSWNEIQRIAQQDSLEAQRHISISDTYQQVDVTPSIATSKNDLQVDQAGNPEMVETPANNTGIISRDLPHSETTFTEGMEPPVNHTPTSNPAPISKKEPVNTVTPITPAQKIPAKPSVETKPDIKNMVAKSESHPFGEQANFAIIFASFSEEENAQRYLQRVQSTHPKAKVWFIRGMYRIGQGATTFPGSELRGIQSSYPKAWVVPLR
jgi:hypothetical protein